jgi:hypothetical protein
MIRIANAIEKQIALGALLNIEQYFSNCGPQAVSEENALRTFYQTLNK